MATVSSLRSVEAVSIKTGGSFLVVKLSLGKLLKKP